MPLTLDSGVVCFLRHSGQLQSFCKHGGDNQESRGKSSAMDELLHPRSHHAWPNQTLTKSSYRNTTQTQEKKAFINTCGGFRAQRQSVRSTEASRYVTGVKYAHREDPPDVGSDSASERQGCTYRTKEALLLPRIFRICPDESPGTSGSRAKASEHILLSAGVLAK